MWWHTGWRLEFCSCAHAPVLRRRYNIYDKMIVSVSLHVSSIRLPKHHTQIIILAPCPSYYANINTQRQHTVVLLSHYPGFPPEILRPTGSDPTRLNRVHQALPHPSIASHPILGRSCLQTSKAQLSTVNSHGNTALWAANALEQARDLASYHIVSCRDYPYASEARNLPHQSTWPKCACGSWLEMESHSLPGQVRLEV